MTERKNKKNRLPEGFTLIESLTAMSIFLIVILVVGSLVIVAQKANSRGSIRGELIQNGRVALDRLTREARQSAELVTDISATTTPSNEIFFQDGHDLDEITYIRYYQDGTDLKRSRIAYYIDDPDSDYVFYNVTDMFSNPPSEKIISDDIVAEYVENIEFLAPDGLVSIDLTLFKGGETVSLSNEVFIRNW